MYVLTSIRELDTSSECGQVCPGHQAQGVRLCGGAEGRRQLAVRRYKDGGQRGHVSQHTGGGAGGAAGPGGRGGGGQNTSASKLLSGWEGSVGGAQIDVSLGCSAFAGDHNQGEQGNNGDVLPELPGSRDTPPDSLLLEPLLTTTPSTVL